MAFSSYQGLRDLSFVPAHKSTTELVYNFMIKENVTLVLSDSFNSYQAINFNIYFEVIGYILSGKKQ